MLSREMFGRYRQRIEDLSIRDDAGLAWFEDLQAIVGQLEAEAARLGHASAEFLYDELRDQFEQEAYLTDRDHRRKVLMAATKLLEIQRA